MHSNTKTSTAVSSILATSLSFSDFDLSDFRLLCQLFACGFIKSSRPAIFLGVLKAKDDLANDEKQKWFCFEKFVSCEGGFEALGRLSLNSRPGKEGELKEK